MIILLLIIYCLSWQRCKSNYKLWEMKQEYSFFLSLILFILLLCSCKTKEVAREVDSSERFASEVSALNEKTKVDTTKTKKVEKTEEYTRIIEIETITEYDTEKQTPSKVTEKEKIFEQGNKSQTDEAENRGITEVSKDSTNHIEDKHEMVETKEDVKEESVMSGMFDNLGKWLGIGIVVLIGIALAWKKIKEFLSL